MSGGCAACEPVNRPVSVEHLLFVRARDGKQRAVQREHGAARAGVGGRQEQQVGPVSALRVQGPESGDGGVSTERGERGSPSGLHPDYSSIKWN